MIDIYWLIEFHGMDWRIFTVPSYCRQLDFCKATFLVNCELPTKAARKRHVCLDNSTTWHYFVLHITCRGRLEVGWSEVPGPINTSTGCSLSLFLVCIKCGSTMSSQGYESDARLPAWCVSPWTTGGIMVASHASAGQARGSGSPIDKESPKTHSGK